MPAQAHGMSPRRRGRPCAPPRPAAAAALARCGSRCCCRASPAYTLEHAAQLERYACGVLAGSPSAGKVLGWCCSSQAVIYCTAGSSMQSERQACSHSGGPALAWSSSRVSGMACSIQSSASCCCRFKPSPYGTSEFPKSQMRSTWPALAAALMHSSPMLDSCDKVGL